MQVTIVDETPLHAAVRGRNLKAVEYLLSLDEIDVRAVNDLGISALFIAKVRGFKAEQKLLEQALCRREKKA